MSVNNFIPEIWAASILENFHNGTVLTALANREYEGEARIGNTVHIPGIEDIEIKDYKTGVLKDESKSPIPRTTAPDVIKTTSTDLVIDQEKSFDFLVDDIDRVQSKYGFDAYTKSASTALVEDTEAFLTTLLATSGQALSDTQAPADATAARGIILRLRTALTKSKVPQGNRYALVNAAFEEALLSGDSKLLDADKSGTTDGLREAIVGRLFGMNVIPSPWLPDDKPMAIGFYAPSLVFASQIDKIEGMRAQDSFADRVRGLHVYGGKVLRAEQSVKVFKAA